MIYYPKPMNQQQAFRKVDCVKIELPIVKNLCQRILALPIHPYITEEEQDEVVKALFKVHREKYFTITII